jgi:predicted ATPase
VIGELALKSPQPDAAKAEAHCQRALALAQQARSWELRAAMSLARLWRDHGKARHLHAERANLRLESPLRIFPISVSERGRTRDLFVID